MNGKEIIFTGFSKKLLPSLNKAADAVIKYEKIKACSINFTKISDTDIKKMNRKYRKVNRITDVISFLISEKPFIGDIYISAGRPKRNAKKYGFTYAQELCYLVIHAVLHLKGYTDYDIENKSLMFSRQDKIFKCLFSRD